MTSTPSSQHHLTTVSEAINSLESEGYTAQLSIEGDGSISGDEHTWVVDDITVDQTMRFEGQSNPDDESMILAITTADGGRGTLVLPYGPDLTGDQADTVRALAAKSSPRSTT